MIRIVKASDIPSSFYQREPASIPEDAVKDIIRAVRAGGDKAVLECGAQFDGVKLSSLAIDAKAIHTAEASFKKNAPAVYDALCYSRDLALLFAKKQRECFTNFETELEPGLFTGQKTLAVERAGVYIPAGRFPLLSTAIMTICPALAAGVKEIIVCTAPRKSPDDKPFADKGILAAVSLCFASAPNMQYAVFASGGAQAIAAMAYGTQSIPACDVIVGPGNKYVTEAKRQIFGQAGIDILAGPTEVLIIADKNARADYIAADMLAQSEHDKDAQAVLVTQSEQLARAVQQEIETQLTHLATSDTSRASIEANGYIVLVSALNDAVFIANKKAPEHLELAMDSGSERDEIVHALHNYGSLFIGHRSAEVLGDYAAGLNHTLPTSASARFTGGLSVRCFLKTVTTLRAENGNGTEQSLKAASVLGRAEGLAAHAHAADIRLIKK